jgi:hypothetical protein
MAVDPKSVKITKEELACFPRCFFEHGDAFDRSLNVPVTGPWVPPEWGTKEFETFQVKIAKARKWWAGKGGAPPDFEPDALAFQEAQQKLDDGSAVPEDVLLDEEEKTAGEEPPVEPGPLGTGDREIAPGECLATVAAEKRLPWKLIWNDSGNAEIKEARRHPDLLLPGDKLTIPKPRPFRKKIRTGTVYRLQILSVPARLNMRFRWCGEPRAGETYELEVDGKTFKGHLGPDGDLVEWVPPKATTGKVTVGEEARKTEYELHIGALKPVTSMEGVQSRLFNLGYHTGEISGKLDEPTRRALRTFQIENDRDPTGEPDEETRARLLRVHDGIQPADRNA